MRDTEATPRAVTSEGVTVTSLLDALALGTVMLDSDGRIVLWSPAAEEILGWPGERVIGKRVTTLLADVHTADHLAGGGPPSRAAATGPGETWQIYAALLRGHYWRGVLRVRRPSGAVVEVEASASRLVDSRGKTFIAAHLVETGRLRAAEQDIAALHALYASLPLGVLILDTEGRVTRVNDAVGRMIRTSAAELIGKTAYDLLPESMADEFSRIQSAVLETGRSVVDMLWTAPEGSDARSLSFGRLTDQSGKALGISCVIMDVTERWEALEKSERARQRLMLLDDVGVALGDVLDVHRIAGALAASLVPRFGDYASVMLDSAVAFGGELHQRYRPTVPLLQLGAAAKERGPAAERLLHQAQDVAFDAGSIFGTVLETGVPRLLTSSNELHGLACPGDPKGEAAGELGIHSMLVVPLTARGFVLGLLAISRAEPRAPFDDDDLALAMELGDRAGVSLDNARLYIRERESALTLQRSLLPQRVPSLPGVTVAHRYVPGTSGAEVGGDWFDVIPLAGGRVALVVGDVTGHGLRAATTMGLFRTAVRTLAGLDLAPAVLLRRVNELVDDLAPGGPAESMMATCVFAVYDPSTRRCTIAKAGHVPPLLLRPRADSPYWAAEPLELPAGAPLGVGGVPFEQRELAVEEGTVLVLYTDGLIETRHEDITEGLSRLSAQLSRAKRSLPLADICDGVIQKLQHRHGPDPTDDVALLMTRLGGLPEGSAVAWTFPARTAAVREARTLVRRALRGWGLDRLADTTSLLVSELVTNSLRYAHGPIDVRMVRGTSLLVEVSDPLPDPPRERSATVEDEGGRGIQLVARESRRWGTRHGPIGKTVWFELSLPG